MGFAATHLQHPHVVNSSRKEMRLHSTGRCSREVEYTDGAAHQLYEVIRLSICQDIVKPARGDLQHEHSLPDSMAKTLTMSPNHTSDLRCCQHDRAVGKAHKNARGSQESISIQNLSFSSLPLPSTNLQYALKRKISTNNFRIGKPARNGVLILVMVCRSRN